MQNQTKIGTSRPGGLSRCRFAACSEVHPGFLTNINIIYFVVLFAKLAFRQALISARNAKCEPVGTPFQGYGEINVDKPWM